MSDSRRTNTVDDFEYLIGKQLGIDRSGFELRGEIVSVESVINDGDPVVTLALDERLPDGRTEFVTPLEDLDLGNTDPQS